MKTTEEIFKSMAQSTIAGDGRRNASYRHVLGRDVLVTEFAPLLNRIICPPIKPVSPLYQW